jgi:superfamily II DNA or RNA helicase
MTETNSDAPIDGKDYVSNFYALLGIEDPNWTAQKIHAFIKGIYDDGWIFRATDIELRAVLSTDGLLNTSGKYEKFIKNLIHNRHTEEGREIIKDFINNDEINEDSTNQDTTSKESLENSDESDETDVLQDDKNDETSPVGYIQPEKIFADTEHYINITVDEEVIKFIIANAKNKLWADIFEDEEKTIEGINKSDISSNYYRETIYKEFMEEYRGTKNIQVPKFMTKGCDFKTLNYMQKLVAYKIKSQQFFANFSGTGTGKTLSAILAAHAINSKLTLVVCPNETVQQWGKEIGKRYGVTNVYMKKDIFNFKFSKEPQFLILNWEMLQKDYDETYFFKLLKNKIDFVILDEVHRVKIRSRKQDKSKKLDKNKRRHKSKRRELTEQILYEIKEKNPDLRLLFMTATPIINNLMEGKTLLELLTGIEYTDIATRTTIPNAVVLHQKLVTMSIRQIPQYPEPTKNIEIITHPGNFTWDEINALKKTPLRIEELLTDARLPYIIKQIDGPTIIYTDFVGNSVTSNETILKKIENAVKDAGHTVDIHSGEIKSGKQRFIDGDVDVLIATQAISEGVNGLQDRCSNLIFNTVPWTHALYEQIVGRVVRTGQKNPVTIHQNLVEIEGLPYDKMKLYDKLEFKKKVAQAAVDGKIPSVEKISPEEAIRKLLHWKERILRGEISAITRAVIIAPLQISETAKKYEKPENYLRDMHLKINTQKSSTTHEQFLKDPEIFADYHRHLEMYRPTWSINPVDHWITRIRRLSRTAKIGDFGCGLAKIADTFGKRVKSFDHTSVGPHVECADISDVKEFIKNGKLDVAIYCQSLMGTNWRDYFKEAARVLKVTGILYVTESASHLEKGRSQHDLISVIESNGFSIMKKEILGGKFIFIEAIKN